MFRYSGPVVVALGRAKPTGIDLLGTAFALPGGKLVTAAHVVGETDVGLVVVLPQSDTHDGYQDTTITAVRHVPAKIEAIDPVKDLAVLVAPDLTITQSLELGSADDAPPGTPVVTFGYPHANYGRLVLTQHAATVGARVLLGSQGIGIKHIVLNIQTRPGQSGSPVLMGQRVVGIVTGAYRPSGGGGILLGDVDPSTLHQTTHAVSAGYVRDML